MAKPSVPGSLRSVVLRCVPVLMLASASPARRRLLEQAGIPHQVRVSGVDEDLIQHAKPAELVKLLAEAKAKAALVMAQALEANPNTAEAMRLMLAKDWMAMGEQLADAPGGSVLMVDPQSPAALLAALKQFQAGKG